VAAGAIVGMATMLIQRRHQQRARDTFRPEAIDRAAIFVPTAQQPD
jgi:hypothetical protein